MTIAIIEIPKGTRYKYEVEEDGTLSLDRPSLVSIPHNYGFIPESLCDDNDPIDIFVASSDPLIPLSRVKVEIVGVITGEDKGKRDDKLLAFILDDHQVKNQVKFDIFSKQCLEYLNTYKQGFVILGVDGQEKALELLNQAKIDFMSL